MEDQKASDDSDQQKKVKFDENEQKQQQEQKERKQDSRQEKSPNQDKDNKKDIQDVEDDEGRASRASRSSRVSSATDGNKGVTDDQKKDKQPVTFEFDSTSQNQQQNTSKRNVDQTKSEDQGQTSSAYTPLTDEEKLNSENMEENKESDKSKENAQTDDTKSSNTNQRQTNSYSLNSRQRKESRRDSEGSDSAQADTKQTKEEPKYETDDDKVTKQDVKSPTRSTKSNNSAKYMNWEDDKSDNASLKEEVNQDPEPEETKENKTTESYENTTSKDETDDDKPKSQTRTEENQTNETQKSPDSPKSKKPRQESPKHVNTVTLVTQRQSTTTKKAPPPQDQKKNTNDRRQMSKSATYPTRKQTTPRGTSSNARDSSRASTARSYRPPSRPRTSMGFDPERRKENDFFHKELQRLKDSLRKESKTIKKPKVRDHYPDVFTSLAPYYNTYTANYLIKMPDLGYKEKQPAEAKKDEEEKDIMYTTRCTAIGLCDPWHSLNMDRSVLPKLETAEIRKKRIERMHASDNKPKSARASSNTDRNSQSQQKRPEAKQGSTRLPKFPVIAPPSSDLTTKELHYGDVPMLRDEMMKSFSHYGEDRKQSDYERTRQDFFRMELDRLAEYHPTTRPHMRAAYFAYLQNTPGSRKAIYDCMKEMNKPKKKEEQSPQAVA